MTTNTGMIKKVMGWCPDASAFTAKRVLLALPVDEGYPPDEKGGGEQKLAGMGWSYIYRNFILLLTSLGIAGFAGSMIAMKSMLEEGFQRDLILKAIFLGIILSVYSIFETWKKFNKIDHPETAGRNLLIKSYVHNAAIMIIVLYLSFTTGRENPILFMLLIFLPSLLTQYPVVVHWERKNRRKIYLVEEKYLRWRPVALPDRS